MKRNVKIIVITATLWGLFLMWFGNTQVPQDQIEFYAGFGLVSLMAAGSIALTDYQERKG